MADQTAPAPDASVGSSSVKTSQSMMPPPAPRSAVSTTFQMRTELPAVPSVENLQFPPLATDDKSAGNFKFTTELLDSGYVGFWRRREDAAFEPTPIELNPPLLYEGINCTLAGVLERLLKLKTTLPSGTVSDRIFETARVLTSGVIIMAFLKCRNLVTSELPAHHASISLKRPRVSENLPIPTGFAFAIQQLGIVNVADTNKEYIAIPCFPTQGHTSGIPTTLLQNWNPNAYASAVEYARMLGLKFSTVDLGKKDGSAWWLFRQTYENDVFQLECPIPEVNFTKAMAVTHSIFLDGDKENPSRPFVKEQSLGPNNFGFMMRNPHPGFHLSCYEAISGEASEVVSNV